MTNRRTFISRGFAALAALGLSGIATIKSKAWAGSTRKAVRIDQRWIDRNARPDGSIALDSSDTDYWIEGDIAISGPFLLLGARSNLDGGGWVESVGPDGWKNMKYPYKVTLRPGCRSAFVAPPGSPFGQARRCQVIGQPRIIPVDPGWANPVCGDLMIA